MQRSETQQNRWILLPLMLRGGSPSPTYEKMAKVLFQKPRFWAIGDRFWYAPPERNLLILQGDRLWYAPPERNLLIWQSDRLWYELRNSRNRIFSKTRFLGYGFYFLLLPKIPRQFDEILL